jgi:hypothetical protein
LLNPQSSLRRHHHRKRNLDKFFILVDCPERASHVVSDIRRAALLDPIRQFQDGSFEDELIFVDLVKQGREQV